MKNGSAFAFPEHVEICVFFVVCKKTGDRMDNLVTVCTRCHTASAHQPGGTLYELEPELNKFTGAAFMNQVRWRIVNEIREIDLSVEVHITYGAVTKRERISRRMEKSHANDAYCMGKYRPKHKAKFTHFKKHRKNDRRLQRFYDAKYVDSRTGKTVKAAALGCERTKRSMPRNNPGNLRQYRGKKLRKGYNTIRVRKKELLPGSQVLYKGETLTVHGTHSRVKPNGEKTINVEFAQPASDGRKSADISKLKIVSHDVVPSWEPVA